MPRDQVNEITAFLAVARERSFTRAAAQLGVTPSALSHTIKGLEERLGLRLLSRTTGNVSTTDIGAQLAASVGPHLEQVQAAIEARSLPCGSPAVTGSRCVGCMARAAAPLQAKEIAIVATADDPKRSLPSGPNSLT
jgi:DNA-binding transcriptional LysR family regulator